MTRVEYGCLVLAVYQGHITRAEAHLIFDVRVELKVADALRAKRREANYRRFRRTIEVPRDVEQLDVLRAVADAIEANDEWVRNLTWYREYVERGEDAEAHAADYLGDATCDEIAAALMGLDRGEDWKLRAPRRIVAPLRRLIDAGLIAKAPVRGYELTDDGVAVLETAGLIDRIEVAA